MCFALSSLVFHCVLIDALIILIVEVNVLNDSIFTVGGECNDRTVDGQSYGHYPPLALVGKIARV